ncbi:carbohydrate-binding protein [uncultured Psychrosphaera sp.]|uniref:carbohydrate-binding protein n=1 Tax=uncultured Psychrosphaera sp. TaxID=1403522 RepID=UPI00262D5CC5|nr:carbohydrate-binding protein [uncultured Psychrosphaera sp.]
MNFNTRKTYTTLAISTALTLASIATSNAASVSITNPGFESDFSGWEDTDPSAISSDEHSGSKAAKITGSGGKFEQDVSVVANTDYELSAYIEGIGKIGADVNGTRHNRTGGGDDYELVTVSFNSGSATTITIYGNYYDGEGRFDDFELNSVGTSTPTTPTDSTSVPGLIQAEDYNDYYDLTSANQGGEYRTDGVDVQTTSDSNGGYNVGWIKADEWLDYTITVTSAGTYTANIRVASNKSTGSFDVLVNGYLSDSLNVGNTGGWQSWETQTIDLGSLSVGEHTIRIDVTGNDFNLNWIDVKQGSSTTPPTGSLDDWDWSIWDLEGGDNDLDPVVGDSMVFDALAAQHVTPNGNGWRHELKIKSDERVAMTELYENFQSNIKLDISDGSKMIVAQHHASDTGTIMKLYVSDTSESGFDDSVANNGIFDVYVRLAKEDGSGEEKQALGTIRSGDNFDFQVINDHGFVTVNAMGETFSLTIEDSSESYLKFGNYLQAQDAESGDDVDDSADWADFYSDAGITESVLTFTNLSYERNVD